MTRRWRLFPKYALLIITLVGSMLIASGAIGLYFSWRETEAHLRALQDEKAQNAATRIEQFVLDIEQQLSWTALPRADADGDALEQRRIEYLKLQRQAPAITEVAWIDPEGREQLRISRLAMDSIGSGTDLSKEERFRKASKGEPYYGPVYFRKGTEPYMTVARPAGSGGGVTAAEVNLKFVWDVVKDIKIDIGGIATSGIAYVVDANGVLIAHPDISLVLKKSDLSILPQVAARVRPGGAVPQVGRDLKGEEVFAASASIRDLRWTVFVETPRTEAFAPLYQTLRLTSLFLVAALVISIAASFFLARALVRPLRALQEGAAKIGAGDLERHIEVRTGDELEGLAEQFNRMTGQLRESYAGLERKVEQRTSELTEALEQQTATAEVLRVISGSMANVQPVFEKITQSCGRLFPGTRIAINLVGADGLIHLAAYDGPAADEFRSAFPFAPNRESGTTLAMIERRVMHYPDVDEPGVPAGVLRGTQQTGAKAVLFAPLLLDDRGIGAIAVSRERAGPFQPSEIALLKTFADQAVIAIENARLFNETQEALERQTATAEVLSVISGSIADSAPVFEKILERCSHLFSSSEQGVLLIADDLVHLAAHRGAAREKLAAMFPSALPESLETSIFSGRVLHYQDILADPDVPPGIRAIAVELGIGSYSQMFAPMVWEGRAIGSLYVTRQPPNGFSDKEIGLLRTFADQAVIAIQNARLFNETREALEQQRASADVLTAISNSISDAKPVFDVILQSCQRLFEGHTVGVTLLRDDGLLDVGANAGPGYEALKSSYPRPLDRSTASGLAILERRVVTFEDIDSGDVPVGSKEGARAMGNHSMAVAPMLFGGKGIGTLWVGRATRGPFLEKEIGLLRTFADQAVIAIQNARLFNETRDALRKVELRTAELSEALDYQTAISDVLRVISQSPTDVTPVFEEILESASRLFGSPMSAVFRHDGRLVHLAATRNWPEAAIADASRFYPAPPNPLMLSGRVILTGKVQSEEDALNDPEYDRQAAGLGHWRRMIGAPLLRDGQPIGAIIVAWPDPGITPTRQADLLETFADQAVIAIENVRLLSETTEALEQQTATAEVLQVISSSVADTQPVFDKILDSCERLFAGTGLGIYLVDEAGLLRMGGYRGQSLGTSGEVQAVAGTFPRPLEGTATELAIRARQVIHYGDALADAGVPAPMRRIAAEIRNFSIAVAPMLWKGGGVGAIQVSRSPPQPFTDKELALLKTFADQAVIAIQNSRLFNEIQAKSRELELANKHKSEFLANMSHELRTPLNAIIGFSEVLSEKMFGDVNDKQLEYLLDIHSSGHHLLSLINDILDLSKIEAGRMELDLATTSLPMLLDNCTTLVRERAGRQGLTLSLEVDDGLGDWVADIRKLKQVVINLLSNAVKFTPAGGRVTLRARRLEHAVEIAVVDTGVGIAPDQQALVFEEFRQAGGDYLRKSEGTGLGLSLAKRFVELHGGTMRVESAPGQGSTFAFILPERVLEAV